MIQRIAQLNPRLLIVMLLAGCFAVIECLPAYSSPSMLASHSDLCLVEALFNSTQPGQSSDRGNVGVVSRKCPLVLVSSRFLGTGKEILAPFQIPLLQTGRGLGGCGEN